MRGIALKTTPEKFFLTIDRNVINQEVLMRLIERLRFEYLVEKAALDKDDVDQLAEDIKSEWWEKNKDLFIPKEV